jgi:hypothetical protein
VVSIAAVHEGAQAKDFLLEKVEPAIQLTDALGEGIAGFIVWGHGGDALHGFAGEVADGACAADFANGLELMIFGVGHSNAEHPAAFGYDGHE